MRPLPVDDLFGLCSHKYGLQLCRAPMGMSSVLLKALPTLGPTAVGDSPCSLQHLQVQAGDKAVGVPVPTLRGDAHYPVAACCLLSS